jgi:hypothetical protein
MTKELDPGTARRRTIRSFAVLLTAMILAVSIWTWVKSRGTTEDDPVSTALHRALEWNGRIWHSYFAPDRLMTIAPPPDGKRPRFNGALGLETPLDPAKWSMEVFVEGQSTPHQAVRMADILSLPRTETATEFKCIEGWSDQISYAGVRFSDFLKAYKMGTRVEGGAFRYVGLVTPDGEYYVSIDMESMLHPQTLLAYEMNGRPLDGPNGAPLRLIIPVKYGIKSLKRIGKIFFSDQRPPDYWAEQGYDWFSGL